MFMALACTAACKVKDVSTREHGEVVEVTVPQPSEAPAEAPPPTETAPASEPTSEQSPEPPAEPDPFPDRNEVSVADLLTALADQVEPIAASPEVRADYEALLERHELPDDDALYLDYVRIKLAFEATRAGGWWGIAWQITNEQPQSDLIWSQWRALEPAALEQGLPTITAIAECDELSALFAFIVHRIGLSKRSEAGLLWPTGNHTVAVWTIDRKSERPTRVVVPTSQIFLDDQQSLDTTGFNPWKQKTIYDYRRQDAKLDLTLPAPLAREFVLQVQRHGRRSQADLQAQRNRRELAQGEAIAAN